MENKRSNNRLECKQESLDTMDNPTMNNFITPLLTDMYQLTMAYSYWKNDRHNEICIFDLFFRQCPFEGQFCIFAGLSEVLEFVRNFHFKQKEIDYLRTILPDCDPEYFEYLSSIDATGVKIYALPEGTLCFPREPLIQVRGPLAVCQLLETTLLTLVNFASLVTTNASRMHQAAGPGKNLLEFGLRRAQGPDGGCTASKYAIVGGFHGTSNVMAGYLDNTIGVKGTHAHSFVASYVSLDQIKEPMLTPKNGGEPVNFVQLVLGYRIQLEYEHTNEGELAAFIAYAISFPDGFLALIDTYDTERSGNLNFIAVALSLEELGYTPIGIRLDSGDLASLSKAVKEEWRKVSEQLTRPLLAKCKVAVSNEITEEVLRRFQDQAAEIDILGIGTHLVTCRDQPALGCIYKMVEIEKRPRIKLSSDIGKVTIPGDKKLYRLYGQSGLALLDLMMLHDETAPVVGTTILCINPDDFTQQVRVTPSAVKVLHVLFWDQGFLAEQMPSVIQSQQTVLHSLSEIGPAYTSLNKPNNQKYKVSISEPLYRLMKKLWDKERQIKELK